MLQEKVSIGFTRMLSNRIVALVGNNAILLKILSRVSANTKPNPKD